MANYQVGQWTGDNWIVRVHTLRRVPKRAPCDTLLYLWPAEQWAWASTVTLAESAAKLPAISVDTDKVRVKLSLLLMEYGKPAWVADEVGVSRAAIKQLQDRQNQDRWRYMPSVEQIRTEINNGMRILDMCRVYGVGLNAIHSYLKAQGVSYQEMVNERNERQRALGVPAQRRGNDGRFATADEVAADRGVSAQ